VEEVLVRLVSYRDGDGVRPGAVGGGEHLLDLGHVAGDVVAILRDDALLAAARASVAAAEVAALPLLDATSLVAPVRPGKMLCLGYNYRGHVPDGAEPEARNASRSRTHSTTSAATRSSTTCRTGRGSVGRASGRSASAPTGSRPWGRGW
jgi:hypothetical protein